MRHLTGLEMQYRPNDTGGVWWCNSHNRQGEFIQENIQRKEHCCDPCLGGIMIPCNCVDLTGLVEIEVTD